jgi:hypothetical protein
MPMPTDPKPGAGLPRFSLTVQPRTDPFAVAQVIAALEGSAGLLLGASQKLRCTREVIESYVARYPEVRAALRRIREELKDFAESQMVALLREKNPSALAFFLRTQAKDRGYSERFQIAQPAPQSEATIDWSLLPLDVLQKFRAELRASGQWLDSDHPPDRPIDMTKISTATLEALWDAFVESGQVSPGARTWQTNAKPH